MMRKFASAAAAAALILCVLFVASSDRQSTSSLDEFSVASVPTADINSNVCESASSVVSAIHASFKDMSQKLLDLYGRMDMAVKEDKCHDVVDLVKEMQSAQSQFASLQTEYTNLSPADQQGVQLCFESTLQPISAKLESFSVLCFPFVKKNHFPKNR